MSVFLVWLFGALFGALVGGLLAWLVIGRNPPTSPEFTEPAPVAAPAELPPPEPATPPPPAPAAAENVPAGDLASRLYPLREAIESFADSAAHPREIENRDEFKKAVALLSDPAVSLDVVAEYALGNNWALSSAAFAAFGNRPDRQPALALVLPRLPNIGAWPLYFALAYVDALAERPPLGETLVRVSQHAVNHGLFPQLFAASFKRREALGDRATFGGALLRETGLSEGLEPMLAKIGHPYAAELQREVEVWKSRRVDRKFLAEIGRFWQEADPLLYEYDGLREPLATAITALTHVPPRSVVIVGEPRVGKTALAQLIGTELNELGYEVFEASGPEVMAGQKYIGELEGRLRRMVAELGAAKRLVWFVPDFMQILLSGMHSGQSAGILDQLLPDINAGRLVILSECTPSGMVRALQLRPALRNALDTVRLRAASNEETGELLREVGARIAQKFSIGIAPDAPATALQLARNYLSGMQLPGAALDLLKLATNRAVSNQEAVLERGTLLTALSQLTGLPRAVLDDSEKIELAEMREFFSQRVIGQDEAVAAVVDRIAMLKAGLTDPARPVGVFLFAGPTGTGKTELAKTLADYLFGSAERLLRLDMSEFQHSGSVDKIIGAADDGRTQSLIQRVRKQPFAVILLDEFEKAHANVWDLFLQVFDDGRLSDTAGQVADFRHTIIILTSNLGATAHQGSGVGFAPRADAFSQEQVKRAVAQSFRPEFVNRLDKVIVFRPLTRDRMRGILLKELARVLERRGLKNREWAVEWESSAQEFLLEKGFTADMGARPLKRAIDQYLLAPLAATLVERRFPTGDQFLFVRSDGQAIQVEFVDPNAEEGATAAAVATDGATDAGALAAAMLQSAGTRAERELLQAQLARLEASIVGDEWERLRETLTTQMAEPGFWERADRQRVLSRYALMDRVRAAFSTARSLYERHGRGLRGKSGQYSKDLARRFALQLWLVDRGVQDALLDAPVEVVLTVEPAMDGGDVENARRWSRRIFSMYVGWSERRHMQAVQRELPGGAPLLVVTGFGAASELSREIGLHVFENEDAGRSVARVRVAPLWTSENAADVPVADLQKALSGSPPGTAIVRRYRSEPSPLVRDTERGWRTGRLEEVLAGDFDLFRPS